MLPSAVSLKENVVNMLQQHDRFGLYDCYTLKCFMRVTFFTWSGKRWTLSRISVWMVLVRCLTVTVIPLGILDYPCRNEMLLWCWRFVYSIINHAWKSYRFHSLGPNNGRNETKTEMADFWYEGMWSLVLNQKWDSNETSAQKWH